MQEIRGEEVRHKEGCCVVLLIIHAMLEYVNKDQFYKTSDN
jgi:hypothetical protein